MLPERTVEREATPDSDPGPSKSRPRTGHTRHMAIGLLAGLGGSALALVLPEPQRIVLASTVLAAVGRLPRLRHRRRERSAIVVQAASFVAFALIAFVGIHLDSRILIGAG